MTAITNHSFNAHLRSPINKRFAAAGTAERTQIPARAPAPPTTSLWRYAESEQAAHRRHGLVVRAIFGVIGALGAGSVAYAAWQTHALMAGNHLQQAVSAFMR